MFVGLLDGETIEIACPNCAKKIKETIRWFKADGRACPGCGVAFDTKEFKRAFDEMERRLSNLGGGGIKIRL
jgi:peptide subunit release factor 1 (eRF1)